MSYQHSGNGEVLPTNGLTGVGAIDAYASKNTQMKDHI